jgi:hypothetical protein
LAWLYVHGEWPDQIDHINHNTSDNRICNLRNVSHSVNHKNLTLSKDNKSGISGVRWEKSTGRWRAEAVQKGIKTITARFDNLFEAACFRKSAEIRFGYHPNHGKAF